MQSPDDARKQTPGKRAAEEWSVRLPQPKPMTDSLADRHEELLRDDDPVEAKVTDEERHMEKAKERPQKTTCQSREMSPALSIRQDQEEQGLPSVPEGQDRGPRS